MRLIHTSDIHLDRSYSSEGFPPRLGNRRRQGLRQVFQKIMERAAAWPADAVLIAGDLFDREYVSRDTVSFLHESFSRLAPIPIFISPGNHDPYVDDSPYAVESWPRHVHIFREPRWSSVELAELGLVVHGFGFDGGEISRNPFGELLVPADGRLHIGMGHASEVNHLPAGQKLYCPFHMEGGIPAGLTYMALGHYHRPMRMTHPAGFVVAYAGAPEALSFNDSGLGQYVEVEVADGVACVTPVPVGETVYVSPRVDCTGFGGPQALLDAVRDLRLESGSSVLLRLTLEGICDPSIWADMESVREVLQNQFEHVELEDRTEPLDDFEALGRENTSLGSFAAAIAEESHMTPPGARHQMLLRARDVGLAAFRGWELPVRGLGRE
jgi:DNA repair exonuclease SbcCD nuclease subunit